LEITLDLPGAACLNDAPVALSASVLNGSSAGSGAWSGNGLDSTGTAFDPQAAGPGLHTLVYTYLESACLLSDTAQISVEQPLEADMVDCSASSSTIVFSWPAQPQDTAYTVEVLTGQSGYFSGLTTFVVDSLAVGDSVQVAITALGGGACGPVTVLAACTTLRCESLVMPADTFICGGGGVVLEVETSGWDSFQWSPASSLSCADCPNPVARPSLTTTYTLVASNSAGCSDTATVTVYVNEIPPSYLPSQPIYFCAGETINICLPDGDLYLWVGPNGFLSQSQCLYLENITPGQAGPYYGLLWVGGCRLQKRIELRAAPAIEITAMTEVVRACPGEAFVLSVQSPNAVSYLWSPSEYLDCPDCPVTEGVVWETTVFTLELTDAFGCQIEKMATVIADPGNCQIDPLAAPPTQTAQPAAAAKQPGEQLAGELRFFPNPTRGKVQLELPMEGRKIIQVFNSAGALAHSAQTSELTAQLDVEHLPSGSYLLRVIAEEGVFSAWLVVAR
jgi:hypothetical protein